MGVVKENGLAQAKREDGIQREGTRGQIWCCFLMNERGHRGRGMSAVKGGRGEGVNKTGRTKGGEIRDYIWGSFL